MIDESKAKEKPRSTVTIVLDHMRLTGFEPVLTNVKQKASSMLESAALNHSAKDAEAIASW